MDPIPTKQQASAMAAALPEELVEEVLLRFPPDDPASLARAAIVSKRWCRLICGRGFRRRFREFHSTPPLLGFVSKRDPTDSELKRFIFPSSSFWSRDHADSPRLFREFHAKLLALACQRNPTAKGRLFVPTSSFKPRHHGHGDRRNLKAVHSCHGRVLLHSKPSRRSAEVLGDLFVWDPITDKLRELPRWQLQLEASYVEGNGDAAVLCAGLGDGCDHLDCHHGPFLVVLAGIDRYAQTFVCVYSSETDRWSEPNYNGRRYVYIDKGNSVLIGSAVYFKCLINSTNEPAIFKYDLQTQEMSSIHIPRVGILEHIKHENIVLMTTEDGRLGFACMLNRSLSLWSRMDHGPDDDDARWAQSRVIELDTVLHKNLKRTHVVAFADTGVGGVILIWSGDRLFSLDLKSGSSKVVGESFGLGCVVPYLSFCTPGPALGAVSIEEGPGDSEPSA